jgi:hypothetical protein
VPRANDMGFAVNIDEVKAEEIAPGVTKRTLMRADQKGYGPPGELTVTHYTLTKGGVLTIQDDPSNFVEYQDYVICGSGLFGINAQPMWAWSKSPHIIPGKVFYPKPSTYVHGNTTIFVPTNRIRKYVHEGESDLRILVHAYTVPHRSYRHCKHKVSFLKNPSAEEQLVTEEYHGLIGTQRFHAVDVQLYDRSEHANPEETCYFMRGEGEMTAGRTYAVRPGSFVYVEEAELHSIKNTSKDGRPLHYICYEFMEQDKMWSERGYPAAV